MENRPGMTCRKCGKDIIPPRQGMTETSAYFGEHLCKEKRGWYHYQIYTDDKGRQVRDEKYLLRCPRFSSDYSGSAPQVATARVKTEEQTFATFRGNESGAKCAAAFPFQSTFFNLTIQGQPGRGKTHLARAMKAAAEEHRQRVEFITAKNLEQLFITRQGVGDDRDEQADAATTIENIAGAALVVIDDLGDERSAASSFFQGELKELMEKMTGRLVVTTNLILYTESDYSRMDAAKKSKSLNQAVGDRVASRLHEQGQKIILSGPDHRQSGAR
jgi:DNA replication protein DnaC